MEHSLDHTRKSMRRRGIMIVSCVMQENICLSLENGKIVGINEKRLSTDAEKNTVLIHEDGHFLSKAFYKPFSEYQIKGQAEYRADKAAIFRNIPYCELRGQLKKNLQSWEIADHFCVTEEYLCKAYALYKELGYDFAS